MSDDAELDIAGESVDEPPLEPVADAAASAAGTAPGHETSAPATERTVPERRRWAALEISSWVVTAVVGAVVATQAVGWSRGGLVAAAQSMTPYLTLLLLPILGLATVRRWWTVSAAVGAAALGMAVIAVPLIFPDRGPAVASQAPRVRVAVVNLLYDNDRIAEAAAAIGQTGPDVIVFTEYTVAHQAELSTQPFAEDFRYRIERHGLLDDGTAVWSRFPLAAQPASSMPSMTNHQVDVTVKVTEGHQFRLWAVHPPYPFDPGWAGELVSIADRASTINAPLLIAGDFNASYWHPAFRAILDKGFTDAHIARGRGWSTSWPTNRWLPAFVRLDHALTNHGLAVVAVDDFDVPGSDHRGFVVTVAAAPQR